MGLFVACSFGLLLRLLIHGLLFWASYLLWAYYFHDNSRETPQNNYIYACSNCHCKCSYKKCEKIYTDLHLRSPLTFLYNYLSQIIWIIINTYLYSITWVMSVSVIQFKKYIYKKSISLFKGKYGIMRIMQILFVLVGKKKTLFLV